jgi:hypothetical protein
LANYRQIFTFLKGQLLVERGIFAKTQNAFESDYDKTRMLGDGSMESPNPNESCQTMCMRVIGVVKLSHLGHPKGIHNTIY